MTSTEKLLLKQQFKNQIRQVYSSPKKNPSKDPWLAVNLSMFFPGIGQLYAGKLWRGLFWIFTQAILIIYTLWSIFHPQGKTLTGLICLAFVGLVYLASIFDAHLCVYYQYKAKTIEKIPRKYKNPWFAVFASRVLPGLGQLYGQKSVSGLAFLSISLICLKLEGLYSTFLIIPPTLAAIATYHAYITFPSEHKRFPISHRSLVAIMVGLIFTWGLISNHVPDWISQRVEMFIIPSKSMQPTLQINDRIFVSRSRNYRPQRGDVVVFRPSDAIKATDPDAQFYIKRVIGKPWEKVQVHNGIVYVNDQPLKEDYIAEPPNYEWGPEVVPVNHYLVLGDNRNNSFDSHAWGFLPKKYLVGQAYKVYWPLDRVKSLILER